MNLVIVESPTKAKTISKFLGDGFDVDSSYGHVRDLPKTVMGVDTEGDFEPNYRVPKRARKHVNRLKKKVKDAETVYLATDEDREGEAIAWHLTHALKIADNDNVKRLVFHEITDRAIENALDHPRAINADLVDAQQARRILDRLVGYTLSPLLWRKVARGLSAGRVQSVAVRLIVDREREREAFTPEEYWSIEASLSPETEDAAPFSAILWERNGKRVKKKDIKSGETANKIVADARDGTWRIDAVTKKERKRNPLPPYTTSTLQQDAARRLHFSAKRTMRLAQTLYETGLITYMRTDSLNIAKQALTDAREHIGSTMGSEYLPKQPRQFKTKQKRAQEAHEAIRPTDPTKTPEKLEGSLKKAEHKLYALIWSRFLASQMKPAIFEKKTVRIIVADAEEDYVFRARGQTCVFDGFTSIYPIKSKEELLPSLNKGDIVALDNLEAIQHFTKPPGRYTEATLVKELEKNGIGRPSTYAPILSTIQERGYVHKERKRFVPTEIGTVVNDLLVEHFPSIVDIDFTARMEEDLDDIAVGEKEWKPVVRTFYEPFAERVAQKDDELKKEDIAIEETDELCEECGEPMVIRLGKYGRFLACTGFPNCHNTRALDSDDAEGGDSDPDEIKDYGPCPECDDGTLVKRRGRYGPFLGCKNFPKCRHTEQIAKTEDGEGDDEDE